MCRCSDIRNRIRLKFRTEKITVDVSQRFGREYVSFINSFIFLDLNDGSLILICVFTSRLAMLLPFTAIHKILKMDTLRVTKYTKIPILSK